MSNNTQASFKNSFQKLVGYFRSHFQEDFQPAYYLSVLLYIAGLIYINYFAFDETIERILVKQYYTSWKCVPAYFFFYGIPYFGVILLQAIFRPHSPHLRDKRFWFKALFAIFVMSLDGAFYLHREVAALVQDDPFGKYFVHKCCATMGSSLAIFVPLFIFWLIIDRKKLGSFYGLRWKGFDWRPYFVFLLVMAILVGGASFFEHFTSYYPTYKVPYMKRVDWFAPQIGYLIYETLYGLDFIWTELMFRGFLVMGLGMVMGKEAIMPMLAVYASRHFAKPLGETVSSVFGGFILGVLALRSKNILGGVFIHMGTALMMDVFAIMQTI